MFADIAHRPALVVALAEHVVPSLNGPKAHRLALALEEWSRGELDSEDGEWLASAVDAVERIGSVDRWAAEIDRLEGDGVSIITVLDDVYPANLRMVPERPPLLFVRGTLEPADDRSFAIVGSRSADEEEASLAYYLAQELATRGVTVVSGLAFGIDAAAHRGAIEAGGRTIAVFGTGIERIYPAAHRTLADDIVGNGACVSQFLPSMTGAKWSFPVRNAVTSGISIGTIVIAAGETSGARIQAKEALRQAKRLLLHRYLVDTEDWAREMAAQPGVLVVHDVEEVGAVIEADLGLEPACF